jgi:WD40 repeat protein
VGTGAERRVPNGHSHRVLSVAFTSDGNTLASGSYDSTVRLWDVGTGAERRVLKGHSQSVWSVAFTSDGNTLASGSEDSTVRLWDVGTGAERRVLKGHSQRVLSVAFTSDGNTLASSSTDGTVRLWNTHSGECFAALVSLAEGWVAFTPDGRHHSQGALGGAFWHAIGLCRFEPGELDPYLSVPLRVPDGKPLYSLPG